MSTSLQKQRIYEKALELHNRVISLKEELVNIFIEMGEVLSKIHRGKLYKPLGYRTFEDYIASPEVSIKRSTVYALIGIYEKLLISFGYSKERLIKIDWSKLNAIFSYIDSENKEKTDKLISMAENMKRNVLIKELKKLWPKSKLRTPLQLGEKINLDELQHAPTNEMGVVFLFAALSKKLGFMVDYINVYFPDCIARQKLRSGKWQVVRIEFEFKSKDFLQHEGHDTDDCDLIICWENNWKDCPIDVISLKEELKEINLHGE